MAIGIATAAWASGSTSVTPALPATPQAGDVHVAYVGCKPYNATIVVPTGWTLIAGTDGANGTTANGVDVGSVLWKAMYRYWVSGDVAPAISVTSGNVSLGVMHQYRPTTGYTINTPVGAKGSDTVSDTAFSSTMDANPGITTADVLSAFTTIAGNNATCATPTMTATGAVIGTVTENPTAEGATATGNDLESSASTATVTSGTASDAPVVGWTLSVAQTGGGAIVRIREAVTPVSFIFNNALAMMGVG